MCPGVKQRVANAKKVTGYFATKDYSYRSTRVSGDGWVLVGDAFGFLDPLYSSGVLLALKSGQLASKAIIEGLAKGDTSEAQLGNWGQVFNEGVDRMRRLVCEYYSGFSFGRMIREYPELRGTLTDLLIGDLFHNGTDKVWGPLESLYEEGREAIPQWNAGTAATATTEKENLLVLPEGRRR
jgi:flavin-dependent dehydrogenase